MLTRNEIKDFIKSVALDEFYTRCLTVYDYMKKITSVFTDDESKKQVENYIGGMASYYLNS